MFSSIKVHSPSDFISLPRSQKSEFLRFALKPARRAISKSVAGTVATEEEQGGGLLLRNGKLVPEFLTNRHKENLEVCATALQNLIDLAKPGMSFQEFIEVASFDVLPISFIYDYLADGQTFCDLPSGRSRQKAIFDLIYFLSADHEKKHGAFQKLADLKKGLVYDPQDIGEKLLAIAAKSYASGSFVPQLHYLTKLDYSFFLIFHTHVFPGGPSPNDLGHAGWTGSISLVFAPSSDFRNVDVYLIEPGDKCGIDFGKIHSFPFDVQLKV
ncbi:MAG: hypothetical protein Q7S22_05865 [Candidatus Micrarchaeota archaeon]|nr:hypothetical protein [Candidatus Micrarchaeota archaeon]